MEGLSTQELVLKDIELHISMAHTAQGPSRSGTGGGQNPGIDVKPDKYFLSSWESYKRATKLTCQAASDQLWHCAIASLKKKVFDSGIRPTDTEEEILAGIKRLTVKAHNNMINIVQFQSLAQDRDELVPQFSARLHGAAAIYEFTVTCDCTKKVSYAEAMQSFQLVRGLYDTEIQEKILSEAANKDLRLADITKLAEAIESGKRSSDVLSRSGGLNRIGTQGDRSQGYPKKCSYCGEQWHEGANWRKQCKGRGATCCNCNRKGHLAVVCKGKKTKDTRDSKETNTIEAQIPNTPTPAQEGETASMNLGFFCTMSAEITKLSHVGMNEFGEWAKIRVEDHPEVVVKIEPDTKGYDELKLDRRPPPKTRDAETSALVDTGA